MPSPIKTDTSNRRCRHVFHKGLVPAVIKLFLIICTCFFGVQVTALSTTGSSCFVRCHNNKQLRQCNGKQQNFLVRRTFPSISYQRSTRFQNDVTIDHARTFGIISRQSRLYVENNNNGENNKVEAIKQRSEKFQDLDQALDPDIGSQLSFLSLEGVIEPVQGIIDNVTDGWALSYADLSPDNTKTAGGQMFLATNTAYLVAGALITVTGDVWFGFCTELCALASFNYHYQQLLNSGTTSDTTVRLALLLDYIFALLSILTALVYLLTSDATDGLPLYTIGIGVAGVACLGLSWVWEYGRPYMFWHSLWHLFSAYAGYVIGTEHWSKNVLP